MIIFIIFFYFMNSEWVLNGIVCKNVVILEGLLSILVNLFFMMIMYVF